MAQPKASSGSRRTRWRAGTPRGSRSGIPPRRRERLIIRDWKGRCLGHTDLDGTQPLDFGACDRHPIFVYPGLSERGFWLVSTLGYVGATKVSPMLVPRSAGDVWFSIELDKAAR